MHFGHIFSVVFNTCCLCERLAWQLNPESEVAMTTLLLHLAAGLTWQSLLTALHRLLHVDT